MMLFFLIACLSLPAFAGSTISPSEALKLIYQNSSEIVMEKKILTPDQKTVLEKKLGSPLKDQWTFLIAKTNNRIDGYALLDNEVGKTEPITILTALDSKGHVKEVEILAYREHIGGEVREKNFLKQYIDKTGKDPIRTGQDIANISGATLSARAVSRAVKRAIALWSVFYETK